LLLFLYESSLNSDEHLMAKHSRCTGAARRKWPARRPFWVYVGSAHRKDIGKREVTIQILPFLCERRAASIKSLLDFASRRSFSSVAVGRNQAESLFGPLDWQEVLTPGKGRPPRKPVFTGDFRALVVIRALNPR